MSRILSTQHGLLNFPLYCPVTTFGDRYPLDRLLRPYLPRAARALMVSYYYAQFMKPSERPSLPLMIDSGGFAALFQGSKILKRNGLGTLVIDREDGKSTLTPHKVLRFQEKLADIAFTLDFPIPSGLSDKEKARRQELTIANAKWAVSNRKNDKMKLFACIQAWDKESARDNAMAYKGLPFDGVAIGGLVPKISDKPLVESIVGEVREVIPDLPLHVLGIGKPETVQWLYSLGVDSVDSSGYVRAAAQGKLWANDKVLKDANLSERMHIALHNLYTAQSLPVPTHLSWQLEQVANS